LTAKGRHATIEEMSKKVKRQPSSSSSSSHGQSKAILLKVIVVGNGGVGKSSLTLQYMYDDFPEEYEPTKAGSFRKNLKIGDEDVVLDIMDTAGQEEYATVRDCYLRAGDAFLCVYSITEKESFRSICELREQILRVKGDDEPIMILVGNKVDLEDRRQVTSADAQSVAEKWGVDFAETSAKTKLNVDQIFMDTMHKIFNQKKAQIEAQAMKKPKKPEKKKCVLL
jgi:Ras-related protein Ral-A